MNPPARIPRGGGYNFISNYTKLILFLRNNCIPVVNTIHRISFGGETSSRIFRLAVRGIKFIEGSSFNKYFSCPILKSCIYCIDLIFISPRFAIRMCYKLATKDFQCTFLNLYCGSSTQICSRFDG